MAFLPTAIAGLGLCLRTAIARNMSLFGCKIRRGESAVTEANRRTISTVVASKKEGSIQDGQKEGEAYHVGVPAFGQLAAWWPT